MKIKITQNHFLWNYDT